MLHWLLGLLQLRNGEVAKALESFAREVNERPRSSIYYREYCVNALIGAGYAHLAASDPAAAADAFRRALEVFDGRGLLGLQQACARSARPQGPECVTEVRIDLERLPVLRFGGVETPRPVEHVTDAADLHRRTRIEIARSLWLAERLLRSIEAGEIEPVLHVHIRRARIELDRAAILDLRGGPVPVVEKCGPGEDRVRFRQRVVEPKRPLRCRTRLGEILPADARR